MMAKSVLWPSLYKIDSGTITSMGDIVLARGMGEKTTQKIYDFTKIIQTCNIKNQLNLF
jgi:hypothetical protein